MFEAAHCVHCIFWVSWIGAESSTVSIESIVSMLSAPKLHPLSALGVSTRPIDEPHIRR